MADDVAAGRAALRDAGIADDDAAPVSLTPFAGRSMAIDLAIVERLATVADDAHAVALRDLATAAERRGWKTVVKDARRALYRLSQRGVAIPAAPADPAPVNRFAARTFEGWVSGIDGRGDRLVWVTRPQPGGGVLAMTAIVNEPAGLRDVTLAELARKTLRRMHDDLRARHHVTMLEADGAYCDALVAEAFERTRAAGTAEAVGQYPTLRARMTTHPPASLIPPLIARVAPDLATDEAAAARGAALLDAPELATWALERHELEPLLAEITAARESPLVLSRPQQEERVQAALAHARGTLFSGDRAAIYRRRLEEMAYVFWAATRRDEAAAAAATAAGLARGDDALPFVTELVRRSVHAYVAADEAKARAEAEGSVLVRPGSPAASTPPPPRPR